jgi:nucleotide-binding universal stress UspA family protein
MPASYRIRRILVPVDGSEYSHYAAEHAVLLAEPDGAEVVFLHVVDEQLAAELASHEPEDGQVARQRLLEHGSKCLQTVGRLAAEHGVAHREEQAEGDPGAIICDVAAREQADAIVIGKIGRHGARRILMGSITRRVIESTDRPVLVVTRPPLETVLAAPASDARH